MLWRSTSRQRRSIRSTLESASIFRDLVLQSSSYKGFAGVALFGSVPFFHHAGYRISATPSGDTSASTWSAHLHIGTTSRVIRFPLSP
jgi:hypothetical protein